MLQQLKQLAMQKLSQKMLSNSLNESATGEAAEQGSNALMDMIQQKMGAGKLDEIKQMLSGEGAEGEGMAGDLKSKLSGILQAKGMDPAEAETEAANTAPDLINGLKEKFQSNDEADSAFDLNAIGDLLKGGNAGDVLNKVKNLF